MIILKTPEQIEKISRAADLLSNLMGEIAKWMNPGVTTRKVDTVAREYILDHGAKPACLGYGGFPATLCIEVNETVVHGFPDNYAMQEGDIVGIDTVVELDGYDADMCYTFPIGEISPEKLRLCKTTKESLYKGINVCKYGNRIGDISHAVQTYCQERGYSIVREMCGHGIGRQMHEDPEIPNYGNAKTGPMIKNGMVLCIEPMVNMGKRNIIIGSDGWTCRTRDSQPSAHYEHTVAVLDDKTRVLTTFDPIAEVLKERFI